MYLKLIDNHRRTHVIEIDEFVFLGWGENGLDRAHRAGDVVVFFDYDDASESGPTDCYFQTTHHGDVQVWGAHPYGAWLMSDEGRTIDAILSFDDTNEMAPDPGPPQAVGGTGFTQVG